MCAQHSQSLEALFLRITGLRVVMPRTAQDAYDAIVTAVYSDDPVIVIENRTLCHGDKTSVTVGGPPRPIGWSNVRHAGEDVTAVTWGAITPRVLDAADALVGKHVSVEVVELTWLQPFDLPAQASAFVAGYLSALLDGLDIGDRLARAVTTAAFVVAVARRLGRPTDTSRATAARHPIRRDPLTADQLGPKCRGRHPEYVAACHALYAGQDVGVQPRGFPRKLPPTRLGTPAKRTRTSSTTHNRCVPLPLPLADPDVIGRLEVRRRDRSGGVVHEYDQAA